MNDMEVARLLEVASLMEERYCQCCQRILRRQCDFWRHVRSRYSNVDLMSWEVKKPPEGLEDPGTHIAAGGEREHSLVSDRGDQDSARDGSSAEEPCVVHTAADNGIAGLRSATGPEREQQWPWSEKWIKAFNVEGSLGMCS
ncbi:MAG: hypothetical protein Q9161_009609 [Pseudevernia consocians]